MRLVRMSSILLALTLLPLGYTLVMNNNLLATPAVFEVKAAVASLRIVVLAFEL